MQGTSTQIKETEDCHSQTVTREKQEHDYHKEYLSVGKQWSTCEMHTYRMWLHGEDIERLNSKKDIA